ncbi:uncharacterized protein [Miscanthus floridulus]|uniref:uncharacterized protein isoform X2 n=1 Tax=Miscanthus floridulus TaxID=154761 RepID=UPI00345949B0
MMAFMKQWATQAISTGLLWGPVVAYYFPRGRSSMYFNKHLRRYARRLVPFLDPFVTIDFHSSNNAYKEVEAYLTKVCTRDAHAFCAEGTVEGCSGFLLRLGEGQEVTDDFQSVTDDSQRVTVWWWSTTTKTTTGWGDTPCFRLMFPQQHRELILDEYLPHVRQTGRENLFVTIDIVEQDKNSTHTRDLKFSEAFEEVKAYLNSACSRDAHNLYADGTVRGDSFLFSLRKGEEVSHIFEGVKLRWSSPKSTDDYGSTTCFRLVFPQQERTLILDEYLPHVRRQGRDIISGKRGKKLYSNRRSSDSWSHIDFEHPTTFDTLAMHPNKKHKIMEDLDNFRRNKDYYRSIGKPWKRGYLLFGPPGTGKSTMIAAMANYLNYDIYDMELTSVSKNSDLHSLLVVIPGKSIIVFEDIDCCFDDVTSQRSNQEGRSTLSRYCDDDDDDDDDKDKSKSKSKSKSKVTLSGLLNFIDGIWSAQTGERIIVFTTNFPEKLDQALIRSGRMDMHIEMSYCCFEAFQTLAMNYLGVGEHPLFHRVEELLQVVEITPADVAECFLRSRTDFAGSDRGVEMETCIGRLIDELEKKAAEPKKRRRLVQFLDPFVTIDIVSNKSSTLGEESRQSSNNAYKEVEAYLTKVCTRDAHAFCAEGTVEGCSGFLLHLREGQEVTDDFRGITVWWLPTTTKTTTGQGDTPIPCFRLMFPQQHRALILDEYLPHVRQTGRENLFVTIDIVEQDKHSIHTSDLKFSEAFEEVKAYLNSACSRDAHDLYADGTVRGHSFLFSIRKGEEVADSFSGVTLRWSSPKSTIDYMSTTCFRLVFPQQHRALILDEYLPHVRRQGRDIISGKRGKKLYSNRRSSGSWSHIDFEHPTTFDTLAMHPNKKRKIMEDLDNFRGNKDYYRRIGKPWKRGYLLYGPPGTGKSTMIAAMANYLNYDIYDMELTSVSNNSDLRSLLVKIPGKSIIVFEDIDCCFDDVTGQRSNHEGRSASSWRYCNDKDKSKVTLSGLLNFIDGVWSAQTGERIIVLTTNFPDKLDQALIRSGRMDMRIEMSYCCFEAFRTLAKNYLGVEAHPLFQRVEELLQVVEITPADIAECFLQSQSQTDIAGSDDRGVETCIGHLIDELEKKAALNELEKKAAQPQPKKRQRQ